MVSAAMPSMHMLNFNNILNVKDSRWLQLEVCREFQRNKCTRPDTECKFAHPPVNVEVQNGRVTACYDSIKGRCNREKPPCKYFHPPQHLKDQLLINGRNHLALKNAFMTQIQGLSPGTQLVHGTLPVDPQQRPWQTCVERNPHQLYLRNEVLFQQASSPYLASIPAMSNFNPYIGSSPVMTVGMTEAVGSPLTGVMPQAVVSAQKVPRTDRLEVCREFQRGACKRCESECRFAHPPDHVGTTDEGTVTVCMDAVKGRCARDPCRYFHPPPHLQAQLRVAQARPAHQPVAFPGMGVPYKRPAPDKSGVPVYQPGNAAYQQALMQQLGGQSYVPVSCEYGGSNTNILALPPPNADASTHSPPANHNAASSSAQSETPSSSSSSSSSSSTTTSYTSSFPSGTSSSTSTHGKASSLHVVSSSASPSVPPTPVNVISYTGYALNANKNIRQPPKSPATTYVASPPAMQAGVPRTYSPGAVTHGALQATIPGMSFAPGMPHMGMGFQMMGGVPMMSTQGMTTGMGGILPAGMQMVPNMTGMGAGMPSMVSPQLVYSQVPASSYVLPQFTALSNNPQYSWAQAGEQPYKKLKTS